MTMTANRTIAVRRTRPRAVSSIPKLRETVKANRWGKLKELSGGRYAAIIGDPGFMDVTYDVVVYERRPSIFGPSRLKLVSIQSIWDDRELAQKTFDAIG